MKDGAHTHGHGGPDLFPVVMAFVVAACVFAAFRWIIARPWWELSLAAVILILAAAGGWRARCAVRRMKTADQAQIATIRTRAEVQPQVSKGTQPPAIENHYHVHHHYAEAPEAARVIRQAVTNTQLPPGHHDQGTR